MGEKCNACAGSGKISRECPDCSGERVCRKYIHNLYGGGWEKVKCKSCEGEGRITNICRLCNGAGIITLNMIIERIEAQAEIIRKTIKEPRCLVCNDTGRVADHSTEGCEGMYDCPNCKGKIR